MLNCDRCGLYAKGESSICAYQNSKKSKDDYKSLEEICNTFYTEYRIVSGYNSKFDMEYIFINGEHQNIREKFPWLREIGKDVDNICDDCVFDMIRQKEATTIDSGAAPFYTICCDDFVDSLDYMENYFTVTRVGNFPYLSYYCMVNIENGDVVYISEDDINFVNYHDYCIICKICLNKIKDKLLNYIPEINKEYPVSYTLSSLRSHAEVFLPFTERGKESLYKNAVTNEDTKDEYNERFLSYISKKNHLLLKKALTFYFISRNLNIIREYVFISKDIFNYILKFC